MSKLFLAVHGKGRNFTRFFYIIKADTYENAEQKLVDEKRYPYHHAGWMKIFQLELKEDITKVYEIID